MSQEDIDKLFGPVRPRVRIRSVNEGLPIPDDPDSVVSRLLAKPRVVHFFTDGPDPVFDPKAYTEYLQSTLGPNFTVENHGDLTSYLVSKNPDSKAKVVSAFVEASFASEGSIPLPKEKKERMEEDWIDHQTEASFRGFAQDQTFTARQFGHTTISHNDYYDLSKLGSGLQEIIPQELKGVHNDTQHSVLIVTGRGVANAERNRLGFPIIHMRGGFATGAISVVSTTGLVEAPGSPKEVAEALRDGILWPDDPEMSRRFKEGIEKLGGLNYPNLKRVLAELFADRMLNYEDPRITEAAKGLGLSMLLFAMGEYGKAHSCSTTDLARDEPDLSKTCRMHDAHWQEELIATQIKAPDQPEFCNYHTEIFKRLQRNT